MIDPRTPVIVGVGQAAERLDDPGYLRRSAVELAAAAAREALADTGGDPGAVAAAVGTVAGVRQFEISVPGAEVPLGRSDNFPRSVAGRIGARPGRAVLEVTGGQAPQHLVNEFAAAIAAGECGAVLLCGAEAISTAERFTNADDRPDFTEHVGGQLEDRGFGLDGMFSMSLLAHGATEMTSQYALLENARRARLGLSREAYADAMGRLFAPFTRVAAANPYAAAPIERDAVELATPSAANRPIADPYTRYLVSRDKVNQGAAVLLMPVAEARRLALPEDRWIFLAGHADLRERDLMDRADLSTSPAAVLAARHALEVAGITAADLATIDLYSCFPIPVWTVAGALGLAHDDPRGLTVTGGLPFFGGAGNNYSMHAIAETAQRLRRTPGSWGFVGANGGAMSKYSAGVYRSGPHEWAADESASLQAALDAREAPGEVEEASGWATIETFTVKHGRDGRRSGIVIGRLEADGRRFLARGPGDFLSEGSPFGRRVQVRWTGLRNEVTLC
ncbi:acetyl-CoA acetyltransferase [Paractinoplanes rishiriensis]|uniref:Acetyl-CoA acetyltransferase n=1 Tax=Paractinoplanes rishiriensis TaxID=1050105 RepID=A0A919K1K6_9ACTN|nr:acetyl-CoA acetyltransferase [Actinoplanes rishiriensis]GIE98593.1 acetyl-CoA acetyltransferase [Actinoplanes rishiriensis]